MVNAILGGDLLPVGDTPETALATQLRFGPDEHLDAVKADGTTDTYPTCGMAKIKERAEEYTAVTAYFNCDILKCLEPVILVDMPGFDSPYETHNKAIKEYIDKGSCYIVLMDETDGGIRDRLMRQLHEIHGVKRPFLFCLSKEGKRDDNDQQNTLRHCQVQLDEAFGKDAPVARLLKNDDASSVLSLLRSIDTDALFKTIFSPQLIAICNEIVHTCNIKISAAEHDADELKRLQSKMDSALETLEDEQDSKISEIAEVCSSEIVKDVIDEVGRAIRAEADTLAGIMTQGDNEGFRDALGEIVNTAIIAKSKGYMENATQKIIDSVTSSISLGDTSALGQNYGDNLSSRVENVTKMMDAFQINGGGISSNMSLMSRAGGTAAVLGSIAFGAETFLNAALPIVGLVLIALPTIVELVSNADGGQKKRDEAKRRLITEIIPRLKNGIRKELTVKVEASLKERENAIRSEMAKRIKADRDALMPQIEAMTDNVEQKAAETARIKKLHDDVMHLMNQIICWQNGEKDSE